LEADHADRQERESAFLDHLRERVRQDGLRAVALHGGVDAGNLSAMLKAVDARANG